MWSILFSLPFPPTSPATLNWGARASHQYPGESKTSLVVQTEFGHCWERSGLCSFSGQQHTLQDRHIQNNIKVGFWFLALLDSFSISRRWRTASFEEPGLASEMKLWSTSAVQVVGELGRIWPGWCWWDWPHLPALLWREGLLLLVPMVDPLPVDYKTGLQMLMASGAVVFILQSPRHNVREATDPIKQI